MLLIRLRWHLSFDNVDLIVSDVTLDPANPYLLETKERIARGAILAFARYIPVNHSLYGFWFEISRFDYFLKNSKVLSKGPEPPQ